MQFLPAIPSERHYGFTTTLLGVQYAFEFQWNERDADGTDGAWYFHLSEVDGTPIALGVKVVLGCPLARTANHALVKDGGFFAYDTSNADRDARLDDFGTRVRLIHVTADELAALILAGPPP